MTVSPGAYKFLFRACKQRFYLRHVIVSSLWIIHWLHDHIVQQNKQLHYFIGSTNAPQDNETKYSCCCLFTMVYKQQFSRLLTYHLKPWLQPVASSILLKKQWTTTRIFWIHHQQFCGGVAQRFPGFPPTIYQHDVVQKFPSVRGCGPVLGGSKLIDFEQICLSVSSFFNQISRWL